jgi:hypothetical protein
MSVWQDTQAPAVEKKAPSFTNNARGSGAGASSVGVGVAVIGPVQAPSKSATSEINFQNLVIVIVPFYS